VGDTKSNGIKKTKWTVGGGVLIALLSTYATVQSARTASSSASDEELKATIAKQEAIINELNTGVIPAMQRGLETIQQTMKEMAQDESAARERIAKLEGILETFLRKVKLSNVSISTYEKPPEKEAPLLEKVPGKKLKKKSLYIPTLQLEKKNVLQHHIDSPIEDKR
jgi:uncharacterized coiled-coil protein SlyX